MLTLFDADGVRRIIGVVLLGGSGGGCIKLMVGGWDVGTGNFRPLVSSPSILLLASNIARTFLSTLFTMTDCDELKSYNQY